MVFQFLRIFDTIPTFIPNCPFVLISNGQSVPKQKSKALREKLETWMRLLSSRGLCVVFWDEDEWVFNELAQQYVDMYYQGEKEELNPFLDELSDESPVEGLWVWAENRTNKNRFDVQLLTARQRDIFDLLRRGYTNLEISNALHIQVRTVEKHVEHIFRKLSIHRREEVTGKSL